MALSKKPTMSRIVAPISSQDKLSSDPMITIADQPQLVALAYLELSPILVEASEHVMGRGFPFIRWQNSELDSRRPKEVKVLAHRVSVF